MLQGAEGSLSRSLRVGRETSGGRSLRGRGRVVCAAGVGGSSAMKGDQPANGASLRSVWYVTVTQRSALKGAIILDQHWLIYSANTPNPLRPIREEIRKSWVSPVTSKGHLRAKGSDNVSTTTHSLLLSSKTGQSTFYCLLQSLSVCIKHQLKSSNPVSLLQSVLLSRSRYRQLQGLKLARGLQNRSSALVQKFKLSSLRGRACQV